MRESNSITNSVTVQKLYLLSIYLVTALHSDCIVTWLSTLSCNLNKLQMWTFHLWNEKSTSYSWLEWLHTLHELRKDWYLLSNQYLINCKIDCKIDCKIEIVKLIFIHCNKSYFCHLLQCLYSFWLKAKINFNQFMTHFANHMLKQQLWNK